jgi:hypothetical protein
VGEGSRDHGRTVLGVGRGRDGPGGGVRRRPAVAAAAACAAARLGGAGAGQRRGKAGEEVHARERGGVDLYTRARAPVPQRSDRRTSDCPDRGTASHAKLRCGPDF